MEKILIVDDSQVMRKMLRDICEESGKGEVIEATNGAEAIELFNTEHPRLIFLDIIMPDVSGMEVLKEIGVMANVVMVSAIGQSAMIGEAKRLGARDYIVKPFEKEVVLKKIQQYLL